MWVISFLLLCLPVGYVLLSHLIYCGFLLASLWFQSLYSSTVWVFFIFSNCSNSHCVHPLFSQVQGTSLWSLPWTLNWVDCLSPLHLALFQRFCLVPSFGTYSPLFTLLNSLCLCLRLRYVGYVCPPWRSGLIGDVLWSPKIYSSLVIRTIWSRVAPM